MSCLNLWKKIAVEQNKKICLTEPQIHAFLDYVCDMPADDVNKRRAIINIFVHSIYLYDDNFTLIINASKKPLSIDNIPLDDIEAALSGDTYTSAKCSSMKLSAPPKKHRNFDTMGIKVAVLLQKRMNDSDARSSTPGPSTGTGGDLQVPDRAWDRGLTPT